jgi:glycosyltransferase involved in cell wall biosynthesis
MPYPSYSIVIPAYNEAARIGDALQSVVACVKERGWNAEIVVVDDGSRDQTAEIVRTFAQSLSASGHPEVRLLQNPGNHGKGYSVRNGILHSFGEVVMFTDADLSSPIEEADGLFAAIADGADIAIGSRWLESSRQTIRQPFYRQFFGRCFNGVTRAVMGLPYADTQCGFKAFTRVAAQTVFQLQTIDRWGFDPEILFIARKRGYACLRTSPSSAGTRSWAAIQSRSSASPARASSSNAPVSCLYAGLGQERPGQFLEFRRRRFVKSRRIRGDV